MYIFFDTETTGLPKDWGKPISDSENWPRLVQIAWLQFDAYDNEISSRSHIIKPEGFSILHNAVKVHGITTETANSEGVFLNSVLLEFSKVVNQSDLIIAHNIDFDKKVVGAEFFRKNISSLLFEKPQCCTMKSSVAYCKIPGNYGYKWPSLKELYSKLFGRTLEEAHNALTDVKACALCYFELKKRRIID